MSLWTYRILRAGSHRIFHAVPDDSNRAACGFMSPGKWYRSRFPEHATITCKACLKALANDARGSVKT